MRVIVLSDTHNRVSFEKLIKITENADFVVHCGDGIKDAEDLKAVLSCPVIAVRGNCDFYGKDTEIFAVENQKIMVAHGHQFRVRVTKGLILEEAKNQCANIVLFGHTHIPEISFMEGVWVINPGSASEARGGYKNTYCEIEISNNAVYPKLLEM